MVAARPRSASAASTSPSSTPASSAARPSRPTAPSSGSTRSWPSTSGASCSASATRAGAAGRRRAVPSWPPRRRRACGPIRARGPTTPRRRPSSTSCGPRPSTTRTQGIRINAVAPGPTDTGMTRPLVDRDRRPVGDHPQRVPMQRFGTARELAEAYLVPGVARRIVHHRCDPRGRRRRSAPTPATSRSGPRTTM